MVEGPGAVLAPAVILDQVLDVHDLAGVEAGQARPLVVLVLHLVDLVGAGVAAGSGDRVVVTAQRDSTPDVPG